MATGMPSFGGITFDPGTLIAGRYEVCSRIGSGGMGQVLRVLDRELNSQVVALKLLHSHLAADESVFKRFLNEVLVARALTHPNIVRIHDIGKAEAGFYYISMEFVDGFSLKDRISLQDPDVPPSERFTPLQFSEALSVLTHVIAGVAYAHDKGVIHRDLKPANVLISKLGEVKLADFGTARIAGMDTHLTQTGQTIGTPDYMSPEQIRGETLDRRCDIYSLGIVAYELATGKRPFVADSAVAVAFKHLSEPVGRVADASRGVPEWFEHVVHRAAAKNRDERYQSAHELMAAIAEHAPEIVRQVGYYQPEKTSRLPTAVETQRAAVYVPDDAPGRPDSHTELAMPVVQPAPPNSSDVKSNGAIPHVEHQAKKDIRFDFQPRPTTGEKELKFDFGSSPVATSAIPGRSPAPPPEKGSNVAWLVGGALALAAVGGGFVYLRKSTSQMVAKVEETVLKPDPVPSPTLIIPPKEESQRDKLERELINDEPPTVVPASEVSKPTELVKESVAPTTTEPTPTTVTTTLPPTTTTVPVVEKYSAELTLRDGAGLTLAGVVSLDKLSESSWEVTVSGVSPEKKRDELAKEFAIQLVNPRDAKLITRINPRDAKASPAAPDSAVLAGSLRQIASASPGPGAYRIDVVRNGEVLTSSNVTLYRASATSAATARPAGNSVLTAGGSAITIETPGATTPTSSVPPTTLPPIARETTPPATEPALTPDLALRFRDRFANGSGGESNLPPAAVRPSSGLPPANPVAPTSVPPNPIPERRLEPQSQPVTPSEVTPPPTEEPSSEPVSETYSGTFSTPDESESGVRRPMILTLAFQGEQITGSANIDGLGTFTVAGRIVARGIELNLRGSSTSFRLSGSRREGVLRGSYIVAGQQVTGQWQANLIRR